MESVYCPKDERQQLTEQWGIFQNDWAYLNMFKIKIRFFYHENYITFFAILQFNNFILNRIIKYPVACEIHLQNFIYFFGDLIFNK